MMPLAKSGGINKSNVEREATTHFKIDAKKKNCAKALLLFANQPHP